jgi:hypothetical protein
MLKLYCSRNFHTYRQVLKAKKGHRLNKTEEALIKDAYEAGAVSLLETLVAAQRIGPRIANKSSAFRHFSTKERATIRQRLNLRAAIVTKTRHACASSGAARSPSLFRWASGMHPDTYILDVNGNPVAEPNLERRREWSSCRLIGKDLRRNLATARPTAQPATITALPYSRGRPAIGASSKRQSASSRTRRKAIRL